MIPLINIPIPPPPAIILDVPTPPTTQQTLEQFAEQHGFRITDGSPVGNLANAVQDIAEAFVEVKKRKDDAEELGEISAALRQPEQGGFSGGGAGSEITIGEQIVLVQQVKNDLEEFCMQIEKYKNDLGSSFYEYRRQGIPPEVADMYEQKYFTYLETTIDKINEDICSAHLPYLDAVISRLC